MNCILIIFMIELFKLNWLEYSSRSIIGFWLNVTANIGSIRCDSTCICIFFFGPSRRFLSQNQIFRTWLSSGTRETVIIIFFAFAKVNNTIKKNFNYKSTKKYKYIDNTCVEINFIKLTLKSNNLLSKLINFTSDTLF